MHKKEMPVAEEVFLIMRELKGNDLFRWKDWKRAWSATSVRWRFAGYMSAGIALKTQVQAGTIMRIRRGVYSLAYPYLYARPARPLYAPGKFRPYADTVAIWEKRRFAR